MGAHERGPCPRWGITARGVGPHPRWPCPRWGVEVRPGVGPTPPPPGLLFHSHGAVCPCGACGGGGRGSGTVRCQPTRRRFEGATTSSVEPGRCRRPCRHSWHCRLVCPRRRAQAVRRGIRPGIPSSTCGGQGEAGRRSSHVAVVRGGCVRVHVHGPPTSRPVGPPVWPRRRRCVFYAPARDGHLRVKVVVTII